jgi:hypothetical protein
LRLATVGHRCIALQRIHIVVGVFAAGRGECAREHAIEREPGRRILIHEYLLSHSLALAFATQTSSVFPQRDIVTRLYLGALAAAQSAVAQRESMRSRQRSARLHVTASAQ